MFLVPIHKVKTTTHLVPHTISDAYESDQLNHKPIASLIFWFKNIASKSYDVKMAKGIRIKIALPN